MACTMPLISSDQNEVIVTITQYEFKSGQRHELENH